MTNEDLKEEWERLQKKDKDEQERKELQRKIKKHKMDNSAVGKFLKGIFG